MQNTRRESKRLPVRVFSYADFPIAANFFCEESMAEWCNSARIFLMRQFFLMRQVFLMR